MFNAKTTKKDIAQAIVVIFAVAGIYSLSSDIDNFLSDYPKWVGYGAVIGGLLLFIWLVGALTSKD